MEANCLNCGTAYKGNFCPECGQKHNTHRITFQAILHDIPHSVLHIDKGLFFTFRQLIYMPGKLIKNYLSGKRVNYFSPFAYLFLLCAVSSFVTHFTAARLHTGTEISSSILFPRVAVFFEHYPALMFCILTPFISVWSWLFNSDMKYNYWENFVINTYLIAQFNLFFIIFSIAKLMHWYSFRNVTPMIILFLGYTTFAYLQLFKRKFSISRIFLNTTMFLLIALTLITGLSITGFMTPWWNIH